jgi:predicted nucleic acid-binding protein
MTAPVFVDTNIFVYARQAGEPRKQLTAARWIERLWREQLGRTSIQVLNELHVTLTRKIQPALSQDDSWDHISALFAWDPQPMNAELLVRGREISRRHTLSWWDSLIVSAAQTQSCALLLTEDLQDQANYGGVTVLNPFSPGASEAPAVYESLPVAGPRHRARGRPKRAGPVFVRTKRTGKP